MVAEGIWAFSRSRIAALAAEDESKAATTISVMRFLGLAPGEMRGPVNGPEAARFGLAHILKCLLRSKVFISGECRFRSRPVEMFAVLGGKPGRKSKRRHAAASSDRSQRLIDP